MRIVDLTSEYENLYFNCLEDWSEEMKEAGCRKEKWYAHMKDRGLRVKLVEDEGGVIGGMIQYVPVELSPADGKDLCFIRCIWVHGYAQGRGNFQNRGFGKALLQAAEDDARALGAKGMAAWGVALPFFMRASWFKRRGYRSVDRLGISVLMWKPFTDDARPPIWIRPKRKPAAVPGRVTVTALAEGWCPAMNITCERAKRAAVEFGEKVLFEEYDTSDRETFAQWGMSDALFVDGRQVNTGPPPSYEKIRDLIGKRVRKLRK